MAKRDYYDVLGVGRDASTENIKKAYRKQAMQYHPDRNPGDKAAEAKFKEASEAYEILKDDEKKAAYNRYGHAAFNQGGPHAGGADFSSSFADVFDDLFGDFMGSRGRARTQTRGGELRFNLEISLDEAFSGKRAKVRVPTSVSCDDCQGSGAAGGAQPITCPTCQGVGKIRAQQGFFTI